MLEAVVNEVLSLEGCRNVVLARVRKLHANGGAIAAELKRLEKQEQRLVGPIERLAVAVESGDGSLNSLTTRLSDRERELAIVRAERQELEERARVRKKLPSKATLFEHLESVKGQLLEDEARATVILRQLLDGPIKVVPYMRVDGKRVVPRL